MSGPTMRLPHRLVAVIGGLALASCPSMAEAHLVTTGLGPLYDGLLHFALTPEDLVPALALALLAGLRGVAHGRRALFVLPAAWLLGGVIGLTVHGGVSATLDSALLRASRRPRGVGRSAPVGRNDPSGRAARPRPRLPQWRRPWLSPGLGAVGLLGIAAAVFTLVALAASFVVPLRAAWARLVVRVAGSWIAAIGLLLIGWAIRSGA